MEIEKYIITYKIGNDIPIYPGWIRDQVKAAVAELQAKIDKKNLHGQHVLTLARKISWGAGGPTSSKPQA